MLDQAHGLYTDLGPRHGLANTLHDLGRVHHRKGEYGQAVDLFTAAHDVYTDVNDVGDPDGQAGVLNSIGDLALDYPAAGDPQALFARARTLARPIGTALHEAHALVGLGRCAHRAHDIHTASTAFTQALTIYQRLDSPDTATVTRYLADLRHHTDHTPRQPAPS